MNGAESLVRTLVNGGVNVCFANPGTSEMHFVAALDRVGLSEVGHQRVTTYSQGMRQRLGLAEILMKRPSIAVLDEPTTALDPHSTQEFLDMIRGLKADGTAVLLSSHHLDQVQSVCDRVALFNRGQIALSGSQRTEGDAPEFQQVRLVVDATSGK